MNSSYQGTQELRRYDCFFHHFHVIRTVVKKGPLNLGCSRKYFCPTILKNFLPYIHNQPFRCLYTLSIVTIKVPGFPQILEIIIPQNTIKFKNKIKLKKNKMLIYKVLKKINIMVKKKKRTLWTEDNPICLHLPHSFICYCISFFVFLNSITTISHTNIYICICVKFICHPMRISILWSQELWCFFDSLTSPEPKTVPGI